MEPFGKLGLSSLKPEAYLLGAKNLDRAFEAKPGLILSLAGQLFDIRKCQLSRKERSFLPFVSSVQVCAKFGSEKQNFAQRIGLTGLGPEVRLTQY